RNNLFRQGRLPRAGFIGYDERQGTIDMGFYLKTLTVLFIAAMALFVYSPESCASGASGQIAKQTCDTEVWKAMTQRAHLESEREIMQNQNLIFKPDSILHYTCFD